LNINEISQWISATFVLVGTFFSVFAAIGMIRMPDLYTRSHAATKSATLGVLCTLLGAFMYFWLSGGLISIRLLLGIFFVFLTAPVAGHLIGRAAYRSGVELAEESVQDGLKAVLEKELETER